MGMVAHLGKFIPHLADLSDPLRQLLRKDSVWVWGETQKKAFEQIKQAFSVTDSPGALQAKPPDDQQMLPTRDLARYYFKFRMMDSAAQCVRRQDLSVTQRNVMP